MESLSLSWFLQVLLGVALVSLLFIAFSYFLKKFAKTSGVITGTGELFKVKAKQQFDLKNSMYLVEVSGKEYILFGSTDRYILLDRQESLKKNQQ